MGSGVRVAIPASNPSLRCDVWYVFLRQGKSPRTEELLIPSGPSEPICELRCMWVRSLCLHSLHILRIPPLRSCSVYRRVGDRSPDHFQLSWEMLPSEVPSPPLVPGIRSPPLSPVPPPLPLRVPALPTYRSGAVPTQAPAAVLPLSLDITVIMSPRIFKDLVRMITRTFYDEETVVVVDYVLFYGRVEEHEMAERMNLPIKHIRKALNELKIHGIVEAQAGKKDRKCTAANGNMFSRGPDEDRLTYWSFNRDIVNVVKFRLNEVKRMLEELVTTAEKQSYYCPNCQSSFTLNEVMVNKSLCKKCKDVQLSQRTEMIEKARENQRVGMESLKALESKLQDCRDTVLPAEFFGDPQEAPSLLPPTPKQSSNRHKILTHRYHSLPDGPLKPAEVDVTLAEEDKKEEEVERPLDPDPEILNYYLTLPVKKAKTEARPTVYVRVEGQEKNIWEVTGGDELRMTAEEHREYGAKLGTVRFDIR